MCILNYEFNFLARIFQLNDTTSSWFILLINQWSSVNSNKISQLSLWESVLRITIKLDPFLLWINKAKWIIYFKLEWTFGHQFNHFIHSFIHSFIQTKYSQYKWSWNSLQEIFFNNIYIKVIFLLTQNTFLSHFFNRTNEPLDLFFLFLHLFLFDLIHLFFLK